MVDGPVERRSAVAAGGSAVPGAPGAANRKSDGLLECWSDRSDGGGGGVLERWSDGSVFMV